MALTGLIARMALRAVPLPPARAGARLRPHGGDYGHGYLYEELFCGDGSETERVAALCLEAGEPVLDLGGGGGRLAARLATLGARVTLVDKSRSMISLAMRRRESLPFEALSRLRIERGDLRELQATGYRCAVSLRNALEHLSGPGEIRTALQRVHGALVPGGVLLAEVHHLPHWEARTGWRAGQWAYAHSARARGRWHHCWERVLPGPGGGVVWEHAVSRDLLRFVHLSTALWLAPVSAWRALFCGAGFRVEKVLGGWHGAPLSETLPKAVFRLRRP